MADGGGGIASAGLLSGADLPLLRGMGLMGLSAEAMPLAAGLAALPGVLGWVQEGAGRAAEVPGLARPASEVGPQPRLRPAERMVEGVREAGAAHGGGGAGGGGDGDVGAGGFRV